MMRPIDPLGDLGAENGCAFLYGKNRGMMFTPCRICLYRAGSSDKHRAGRCDEHRESLGLEKMWR